MERAPCVAVEARAGTPGLDTGSVRCASILLGRGSGGGNRRRPHPVRAAGPPRPGEGKRLAPRKQTGQPGITPAVTLLLVGFSRGSLCSVASTPPWPPPAAAYRLQPTGDSARPDPPPPNGERWHVTPAIT
jgi:hypothetical protein